MEVPGQNSIRREHACCLGRFWVTRKQTSSPECVVCSPRKETFSQSKTRKAPIYFCILRLRLSMICQMSALSILTNVPMITVSLGHQLTLSVGSPLHFLRTWLACRNFRLGALGWVRTTITNTRGVHEFTTDAVFP